MLRGLILSWGEISTWVIYYFGLFSNRISLCYARVCHLVTSAVIAKLQVLGMTPPTRPVYLQKYLCFLYASKADYAQILICKLPKQMQRKIVFIMKFHLFSSSVI